MIRILCINDEIGALTLQRIILESAGYEVFTTTSGEEALKILSEEPFDLIIQDFMRPEMNGFEFLQQLRADDTLRSLLVLAVTAGSREQRAEQLKQVGLDFDRDLDGYLSRPHTIYELVYTVHTILKEHGKI